jgi:hypothetical protein
VNDATVYDFLISFYQTSAYPSCPRTRYILCQTHEQTSPDNMKVSVETELMKNHKLAEVMAPDLAFDVLQTLDGDALFFSIGTDHVFYVTRETRGWKTGWNKIDLSSSLASSHDNLPIAAKTFSITQNPQSHAVDLALVITVAGVDFLYTSFENSQTAEIWEQGVTWTPMTFDAPSVPAPGPLTIADVYMLNVSGQQGVDSVPREVCFVDVLRQPGDTLQLLDRYYIESSQGPHWKPHGLAIDLNAGSIVSCPGNRSNDPVPGIYTFGAIEDTKELIYAPQYDFWDPHVAPRPARLSLPEGATVVSSCLNADGVTNLFVAASKGLYVFSPDNQHDQATPVLAIPAVVIGKSNVLAGVTSLASMTISGRTAVWGTNAQGDLFYTTCTAGKETDSSSWSLPFPICSGVERFTFYINSSAANNVVFAHVSGQKLLQLTQDPQTGRWMTRSILLPSTSNDHVFEINCFTTHLQVLDDDSIPMADCEVNITSTSQVTVYINDVYHVLNPTLPVSVSSDMTGAITIIQETLSLSAVQYQVATSGAPITSIRVDPLSKALQTLSNIHSGDDLGKVRVHDKHGDEKLLVSGSISSDLRSGVVKSITNLLIVHDKLPADGTVQKAPVKRKNVSSNDRRYEDQLMDHGCDAKQGLFWGMSFHGGACDFYEGHTAPDNPRLHEAYGSRVASKSEVIRGLDDILDVAASDMFHWFQNAWDDIESFAIQQADNLYHFTLKIGGQVYSAVLDCVSKVVDAIEFVLSKIELFIEELVMWLGFLFRWADIKRTHRVLKTMTRSYARKAVDSLVTLEDDINTAFVGIEDKINAWAGITDPGENIGINTLTEPIIPGSNTPQASWSLYHLKNGASHGTTSDETSKPVDKLLDQALRDLTDLVEQEGDYLETMIKQIQEQVVQQLPSLTPMDIFKRLFGVLADLTLKTARNVLVKLVDVIKVFSDLLLQFLDAPAEIPVISWVYKLVTGSDLSMLDLICFITAIPTTVIYKAMSGYAPFPDDEHTQALIDAHDFEAFRSILSTPRVSPMKHASDLNKVQRNDKPSDQEGSSSIDPSVVFNILGGVGGLLVIVFSDAKRIENARPRPDPFPVSQRKRFIRRAFISSYFLYLLPNVPTSGFLRWYSIFNDVISALDFLKCILDNQFDLSNLHYDERRAATVESFINIVWLVPAGGALLAAAEEKRFKDSDGTSFGANASFDIGGMLSLAAEDDTESGLLAFAAQQKLNLFYVGLCWGTAELVRRGR